MITRTFLTAAILAGLGTPVFTTHACAAEADAAARELDARIAAERMHADADAMKAKAMAAAAARDTPTKLAKIVPIPGVEFERAYFTMEVPTALKGAVRVEIWGDGTCRYLRAREDGVLALVTEHKLAEERVKRLSALLGKTEWLTKKSAPNPGISHGEIYTAKVMRTLEAGLTEAASFDSGAEEPYKLLRLFIVGVVRQEELYDKVSARNPEALDELERRLSDESKPAVEIDPGRFQDAMVKVVRDPLDLEDAQVATAVRAMRYYKAKAERKSVAALANDRSEKVRAAVAETLADFAGPESVAVLRNMVHRTRAAGFGLVRMGPEAVPTVVEIIVMADGPRTSAQQMEMIRAYVDNWERVPKPVDERVVEAVQQSLAAAHARQDGSETRYHQKFLELVIEMKPE